jgi:hypothetical protein
MSDLLTAISDVIDIVSLTADPMIVYGHWGEEVKGPSDRHVLPQEALGSIGWVRSWRDNAIWSWGVTADLALSEDPSVSSTDAWVAGARSSRYTLAATGAKVDKRAQAVAVAAEFAYNHPDAVHRGFHALPGIAAVDDVIALWNPPRERLTPQQVSRMQEAQRPDPVLSEIMASISGLAGSWGVSPGAFDRSDWVRTQSPGSPGALPRKRTSRCLDDEGIPNGNCRWGG